MLRSYLLVVLGCALAATLLAPSSAAANAPEDLQGLGARTNAMGGAGSAAANDFSATYYAPSNLAYCENSHISVALRHTVYGLDQNAEDPDATPAKELRDQTRVSFGFCNLLPFNLSLGMLFGMGLQDPMTLDQTSVDATPRFALYGDNLEVLTITLGAAYRPIPEISLGIGVSILVNSVLALDIDAPVLVDDRVLTADINWNLKPRASLIASFTAMPLPNLRLTGTFRTALYHDLEAPAHIDIPPLPTPLDLILRSGAFYSPRQINGGASYEPLPGLTAAFDLAWFNYAAAPGPYIWATPVRRDSLEGIFDYYDPADADLGYRNILVPRVGLEYRFLEQEQVAARLGYAFRPSAIDTQQPITEESPTTNLMDGNVHSMSFGGGYRFGDRPSDPPPAPSEQEESDEAPDPHASNGANGSIDFYVRVNLMQNERVERMPRAADDTVGSYSFGGTILETGLTATLGWY